MTFSIWKRLSRYLFIFLSFYLILSSFSFRAFAFDVSASPSPLPDFPYTDDDFSSSNSFNFTEDFECPIYSSDGYQVGVYVMKFFGRVGYSPHNPTRKTQAIVGFSFPSEFIINGLHIGRDLVDISQIFFHYGQFNDPQDYFPLYIPSSLIINPSNGFTVDKGITESYNGSYFALRPAGYDFYNDTHIPDISSQYYFYVRMDSSELLRLERDGEHKWYEDIWEVTSPYYDNSTFYNICINCIYNGGVFLDSPVTPGYSSRPHNDFTSPGWQNLFGDILSYSAYRYSNHNNDYGSFYLPDELYNEFSFKFVLPFDYLTLSQLENLNSLKIIVDEISGLKSSMYTLNDMVDSIYSRLNLIRQYTQTSSQTISVVSQDLKSVLSLLTSIDSSLSSISSSQDYTQAFNKLQASLDNLLRIFENFSVEKLESFLDSLDVAITNLDNMFSEFVEVSSDQLENFNASLTKLENSSQKLEELADRLSVNQPQVDVNLTIDNIINSDFDLSVSWVSDLFSLPLVLTLVTAVLSLALLSYVFFGKKA